MATMNGLDIDKEVRLGINDQSGGYLDAVDLVRYVNRAVNAVVKDACQALMGAGGVGVRTITPLDESGDPSTVLAGNLSIDDRWKDAVVAHVKRTVFSRKGDANRYDPEAANAAALEYAAEIAK